VTLRVTRRTSASVVAQASIKAQCAAPARAITARRE
jgi:hypothetical protein